MYEIEEKMTAAGFDNQRVKEAQVLYVLALSDFSEEAGFVDKLVGCFAEGQSDADLIAAANGAFGTDLSAEDFTKVMSAIRAVYSADDGIRRSDIGDQCRRGYGQCRCQTGVRAERSA